MSPGFNYLSLRTTLRSRPDPNDAGVVIEEYDNRDCLRRYTTTYEGVATVSSLRHLTPELYLARSFHTLLDKFTPPHPYTFQRLNAFYYYRSLTILSHGREKAFHYYTDFFFYFHNDTIVKSTSTKKKHAPRLA
jgi:hypothetical protein